MNMGQIDRAMAEARRFLEAAKAAKERIVREYAEHRELDPEAGEWLPDPRQTDQHSACLSGSRETGACRRASLDLTRAMADMRRRTC